MSSEKAPLTGTGVPAEDTVPPSGSGVASESSSDLEHSDKEQPVMATQIDTRGEIVYASEPDSDSEPQDANACSKCGKTFRNKVSLHRHLSQTHKGKDHLCPYCGKGFKRRTNLKDHIHTHTNERPYPCPECDKRFTQRGALKTHIQGVHRGIRWQCLMEGCGRVFSVRSGAVQHMKHQHPRGSFEEYNPTRIPPLTEEEKAASRPSSRASSTRRSTPSLSVHTSPDGKPAPKRVTKRRQSRRSPRFRAKEEEEEWTPETKTEYPTRLYSRASSASVTSSTSRRASSRAPSRDRDGSTPQYRVKHEPQMLVSQRPLRSRSVGGRLPPPPPRDRPTPRLTNRERERIAMKASAREHQRLPPSQPVSPDVVSTLQPMSKREAQKMARRERRAELAREREAEKARLLERERERQALAQEDVRERERLFLSRFQPSPSAEREVFEGEKDTDTSLLGHESGEDREVSALDILCRAVEGERASVSPYRPLNSPVAGSKHVTHKAI
ncbi:hypothetical protein KIPB_000623 [Kipferlia bialata]|uniref:C2H2-type domain-containing protein n=1 Tax=Kipferlia bialata TaxID=797122 RepID=A0A9K3GF57_9EUKA|nr:hypothetical protein KIPB_000623 [Kipferlia bialata]|eukprot:g623.t1